MKKLKCVGIKEGLVMLTGDIEKVILLNQSVGKFVDSELRYKGLI